MAGGGSLSINRPDGLSDREVAPTGYSLILLFNVSGQDAAPTNRKSKGWWAVPTLQLQFA